METLTKLFRAAQAQWNSERAQHAREAALSKLQVWFPRAPQKADQLPVMPFSWWPRYRAGRIIQLVLLTSGYLQSYTFRGGLYTVAFGFFFLTIIRYVVFRFSRASQSFPAAPWWRTPGAVAALACLVLFTFFRPAHRPRPSIREDPDSYFASSRDSSDSSDNDMDSRLLSAVEEAFSGETRRTNSSPAYRGGSQSSGYGSGWHYSNCNQCSSRGTIKTPSGYTTTCPACGGTGKVRTSGPEVQALPKF